MSDPRLVPDPSRITERTPAQVARPLVDLRRAPEGPRDRQLLFGETVTVLGRSGAHAYVTADRDGYCGWLEDAALGPVTTATHRVRAPATHAYAAPDLKSPDRAGLSLGSRVAVRTTANGFAETPLGHVPLQHLAPLDAPETDPVAVAETFLGTPYLWGGNSRWGIDCSGLVQAALLACGHACPGDSDLQAALGIPATGPFLRGDLVFWKGHVALVRDARTLIHANAHAMATTIEGIAATRARIAAAGEGAPTAHRRLAPFHALAGTAGGA